VTELVIVAADLYLAGSSAAMLPMSSSLPGLARLLQFGRVEMLAHGWRCELARWLGRCDLAALSPAPIAATAVLHGASSRSPADAFVWFADPLHLVASLTSVHLMPQGLLRVDAAAQGHLVQAFDDTFGGAGYALTPTRAGRFLATGPALSGDIQTTDPARCLGASLEHALPRGGGAAALRRLAAEIEMWLHEHPVNAARAAARRAPISTLWLWGGGRLLAAQMQPSSADNAPPSVGFFSDDAYVEGLAHLLGAHCASPPRSLAALGALKPQRIVTTLELFTAAQTGALDATTPLAALESFDREWLMPAVGALSRGSLTRCTLIANDRRVSFTRHDRWRLWRHSRSRSALGALTAGPPSKT